MTQPISVNIGNGDPIEVSMDGIVLNALTGGITVNTPTNLIGVLKGASGNVAVATNVDVVSTLGYTPEDVANKENTTLDTSATKYPTNNLVSTALATKQATITGAASTVVASDLTASRTIISNASGKITASSISTTKLNYLANVSSDIQAQITAHTTSINNINATIGTTTLTTTSQIIKTAINEINAKTGIGLKFGTSATASATAEKEVTSTGFTLSRGALLEVVLSNTNTATTPTLNVNSLGAKNIKNTFGDAFIYLPSGAKILFEYNGTEFICLSAVQGYGQADYFGTITSKSWNTAYQAECDGYVRVYANFQTTAAQLNYSSASDMSSPQLGWYVYTNSGTSSNMSVIKISKGVYYKATGGSAAQAIEFIPAKGAY